MQERGLWRLLLHHRHLAPSASSVKALATSACGMVYICGAARTPLGSFQGGLSHLSAVELGGIAVHAAVRRSGADPTEVSEVLLGNVCSANLGQAPARQVALQAGLPLSTDCTSINKVCSSGMKAIMLGAQAIATGAHSVVVVGGFESMTNVPYYAPAARSGARLGHSTLLDGLLRDGLTDSLHDMHMGECADECAATHGISRDAQDDHAVQSVDRARAAAAAGITEWEIAPVPAATRIKVDRPPYKLTSDVSGSSSGKDSVSSSCSLASRPAAELIFHDEAPAKMNPIKLRRLKPCFTADGTVTAGNASPITDGAAALVLASPEAVHRLKLTVLGRVLGYADAAQDPRDFATSPALAVPKALAAAGMHQGQVDYWEINEAFSVVDLVNQKLLGLDPAKTNVLGGSVALGHPIGASGARLVVTLLNVLRVKEDGRVGVAAICNGGGGASAIVIQRMTGVGGGGGAGRHRGGERVSSLGG